MSDTSSVICHRSSTSAYSYFRKSLRSLRLNEFPCGSGSWRNPKARKPDGTFMVTGKDYGVQYEKVEQLLDYLDCNDWKSNTSWSKEAEELKKQAVLKPWMFENEENCVNFVHPYFKSLQFRDKNIDNVDKKMLKFENLEELVLTANQLSEVNSRHLPPKLQILELGSNILERITTLCRKPLPPLLHLGLSYNRLIHLSEYKYFTKSYWPHLMSLDLSFNNLSHFAQLIEALQTLPDLRNLNLQGNPLSLTPSYRGFVVDALKTLTYFDDVIISPDERHHFKGLGKKKDLARDECYLTINMVGICGLPVPYELQECDRPDYPVVSTQYFMSYNMLKDEGETTDQMEDNGVTQIPVVGDEDMVCNKSKSKQYSKVIDLQYTKTHKTNKLLKLRDFLNNGIKLVIYAKTVKSWKVEEVVDEQNGKNSDKTNRRAKTPTKLQRSKKELETVVLRKDPAKYREIGSYVVDTTSLVLGQTSTISSICYCGGGPLPPEEQLRELVSLNQKPEESPRGKDKNIKGKLSNKERKSGKSPIPCDSQPFAHLPLLVDFKLQLLRWETAADCHKST